jgi:hypothetical protein
MFQQRLHITKNSYIELTSRIFEGQDQLLFSIFGPKNETEAVLSSVVLDDKAVERLETMLAEAKNRKRSAMV